MSAHQQKTRTYTGLKGRDGYPQWPGEIPPHRALECFNVDGYRASFARKRGGALSLSLTFSAGGPFGAGIFGLYRYVPGIDPTVAELWAVDGNALLGRLAGATTWTAPTLKDNIGTSRPQDMTAATFNGKLFFAYKASAAIDRLHVWDGATVRRCGLATPAAATVANTGAGAYAATIRYYRVQWLELSGTTIRRQSELSASVSFTPSGAGTAARVTQPAVAGEGETHWRVYASDDDSVFKLQSTIAIATTTYDDSTNPSAYTGDAPPLAGTHTNWTSVKYLLATDAHLLGAGANESGLNSRVWWSGVPNQTSISYEEESVIQTTAVSNYADLDENDGGEITGLGLHGTRPVVFKRNQLWWLVPTGMDNPFYKPRPIYKGSGIGCIRQQTIVNGEDAAGRPCLYWLSDFGPYRMGADGPQCLVDDIQDLWDSINIAATNVVAHGIFHTAKRQVWWWITGAGDNSPTIKVVFDVRKGIAYEDGRVRDGWYRHSGLSAQARCSVMFSNTVGATMSRDLKPYVGHTNGTVVLKCDTADLDDNGTAFQAYVDLPDTHFGGIGALCAMGNPILVGSVGTQSLAVTMTRDYGAEARGPTTTAMAAAGTETRTTKLVEGIETADAHAVRVRIGDSAAVASVQWVIDAVALRYEVQEAL